MSDQFAPKIINLSVAKLRNKATIACVSRLDLDDFELNLIRPDLIRGSLENKYNIKPYNEPCANP
jgi:hypothetical protein